MEDDHGVVAACVRRAPGLVGDRDPRQAPPELQGVLRRVRPRLPGGRLELHGGELYPPPAGKPTPERQERPPAALYSPPCPGYSSPLPWNSGAPSRAW